jgi:hypothetical protein
MREMNKIKTRRVSKEDEMEVQFEKLEKFISELTKDIEKTPALKKAWDQLNFSMLHPSDVEKAIFMAFMVAFD